MIEQKIYNTLVNEIGCVEAKRLTKLLNIALLSHQQGLLYSALTNNYQQTQQVVSKLDNCIEVKNASVLLTKLEKTTTLVQSKMVKHKRYWKLS